MWLLTRRGIIREQGVTECLTQPLLILAFVCLLFLLSSPACDHHHSLLLPLGFTVPAYLPVSKPLQVHAKRWMMKGTSPSNVAESHSQWTNYVYVEQKEQKSRAVIARVTFKRLAVRSAKRNDQWRWTPFSLGPIINHAPTCNFSPHFFSWLEIGIAEFWIF